MPRKLRYVPESGMLIETTCRILQGRMLLQPSRLLNESIVGTLALAQQRYGVEVVCVVVMSTHMHLLLRVEDAQQMAGFQRFIGSNIGREVARITGWREKIWGRRYAAIPVSTEPEAQIARLRYLLSHGVKENLVERCTDWPGVHAAEALSIGRPIQGFWFDRTAEFNALRRGKDVGPYTFASPQNLVFARLPCWEHLGQTEYQKRIAKIISEIEAEARHERLRGERAQPLGREAILHQNPFAKPRKIARSPAPWIHAAHRATRIAFRESYRLFEEAYRAASERWLGGKVGATFPPGCFIPTLGFVGL